MNTATYDIKAIIGLGNPGARFHGTRHNIGFMIVDALAAQYHASWQHKDDMELAQIIIKGHPVLLVKPQTFMNESGRVIPFLLKKGMRADNLLVVHDELEKPFGSLAMNRGGSARGHNGLRSIMGVIGPDFVRLRFGIGRPEHKEEVGDYVLERFTIDEKIVVQHIQDAVVMIDNLFQ